LPPGAAGAKCSEATLHGRYLYAYAGFEIQEKNQVPIAVAGHQVFNGNGSQHGVSSVSFNGEIFCEQPFSGTYTVNADCTATFTYADGDPFRFDLFVAPDGSKFTLVQVNPSDSTLQG
jgi:hypothetical protein